MSKYFGDVWRLFKDIERSVKLVEGQLQSIENFFGLVNDQVVTLPTPERVSALDFEQLSDSIAMTKQMLEETSDTFAALDSHNRDIGNYESAPFQQLALQISSYPNTSRVIESHWTRLGSGLGDSSFCRLPFVREIEKLKCFANWSVFPELTSARSRRKSVV